MNARSPLQMPLVRRSLYYFGQSVVNPRRAFSLLKDESTFSVGFFLNALKWVLCEFYVYYLYRTDQVLFAEPWLNIPASRYRYYQLFFYIPYGILIWVFTAGVVQALARAFGGRDRFSSTLNLVGIMIFTPFVFIDTIDALFILLNAGDWNIVFNTVTRTLYVLWSAVLLVFGLNVIHEVRSGKATAIALVVIPLLIVVNLVFIR